MEETPKGATPGRIKDLGFYFLNLLSAKAWQYLGLMVHPESGAILVDLEEARVGAGVLVPLDELAAQYRPRYTTGDAERLMADAEVDFVVCGTKPDARLPIMRLA